ncbi:MAG TPA: M56 family metallopeptidase, partial [Verrucomicrobiae bacterium]|nr:M56 family metallopeptidase [Verrucomicrobiae bacterium]
MNFTELTTAIFGKVIQATVAASVLAVIVLGIQAALRERLSAAWRFALWLPVLLRLMVPAFPESPLSIFNAARWFRAGTPTPPKAVVAIVEPRNNPEKVRAQSIIQVPAVPHPPAEPFSDWFSEPLINPGLESGVPESAERESRFERFSAAPALPTEDRAVDRYSLIKSTLFRTFPLVWFSVAGALLGRLVLGTFWLHLRLVRHRSRSNPQLAQLVSRLRSETRTLWKPEIIETPLIASPGLFGCLRPKLLLPPGIASRLSDAELRHVFLHELAHLKRGDLFINWGMAVAQALHWFNPIVWLAFRHLRIQRELACDEMALRAGGAMDARAYGETILKLLQDVTARRAIPAVVGILEERQAVKLRLREIARFSPGSAKFWKAGIPLLVALALVGLSNAQTDRPGKATAGEQVDGGAGVLPEEARRPGLEDLEKEYENQTRDLESERKKLEELRGSLKISDDDQETPSEAIAAIEKDRVEAQRIFTSNSALLKELKPLNRAQLRNALPTFFPNERLNELLAELAKAEQQHASLRGQYSEEHPEIHRIQAVIMRIDQQVEGRIDGIMKGLEVKVAAAREQADELLQAENTVKKQDAARREKTAPYFLARRNLENKQRLLDTLYVRIMTEKVNLVAARQRDAIPALQRAYTEQELKVAGLKKQVEALRRNLGGSDPEIEHRSVESAQVRQLEKDRNEKEEAVTYQNTLLEELRKLSRADLRNALSTLPSPDRNLGQRLAELSKAEEQYAVLSNDYDTDAPEVHRLRDLILTINKQIEERLDGIMKGLEVKAAAAKEQRDESAQKVNEAKANDIQQRQKLPPYFAAKRELEKEQKVLDTIYMRILAEKVDAQIPRGAIPQKTNEDSLRRGANASNEGNGQTLDAVASKSPIYQRTFTMNAGVLFRALGLDPKTLVRNPMSGESVTYLDSTGDRLLPRTYGNGSPMGFPLELQQAVNRFFAAKGADFATTNIPTNSAIFNPFEGTLYAQGTLEHLKLV